jgi:hypothetical protein
LWYPCQAINRILDVIFVGGGKIKHSPKYMLFRCVGTISFYGYLGLGVICLFISFEFSALKIFSLSAVLLLFEEKECFGEH